MTEDVRWKQRFRSFSKALQTLTEAMELSQHRPLSRLENKGMIQGFKATHEYGWNVLKGYLESKGYIGLLGSLDTTRTALKSGLIADNGTWLDMIEARKQTLNAYQLDVADFLVQAISQRFYPAFLALESWLNHNAMQSSESDRSYAWAGARGVV